MTKTKTHFMGIPLNRLATRDSYISKRLMNGDRRNCNYPATGTAKSDAVQCRNAGDNGRDDANSKTHFMGIPVNRLATQGSYVSKRLMSGDRRNNLSW